MTNQEVVTQENQSPRGNKVLRLIGVVAAGFAIGTVMKTFVCGKFATSCPCHNQAEAESDQS